RTIRIWKIGRFKSSASAAPNRLVESLSSRLATLLAPILPAPMVPTATPPVVNAVPTILDQTLANQSNASVNAHAGSVPALAFSPDGRTLVSGGDTGGIRLWNGVTGAAITGNDRQPIMLMAPNGHSKIVEAVAFSPDGTYFVS